MIRKIYWMILLAFIGATLGAMGAVLVLGTQTLTAILIVLIAWVVLYYALLFGQYAALRAQAASVPAPAPPYPAAVMVGALLLWALALVPFNVLGHDGAIACGITPGTPLWEIAANAPSLFPLVPALWLAPRAVALDEAAPPPREADDGGAPR